MGNSFGRLSHHLAGVTKRSIESVGEICETQRRALAGQLRACSGVMGDSGISVYRRRINDLVIKTEPSRLGVYQQFSDSRRDYFNGWCISVSVSDSFQYFPQQFFNDLGRKFQSKNLANHVLGYGNIFTYGVNLHPLGI